MGRIPTRVNLQCKYTWQQFGAKSLKIGTNTRLDESNLRI